MPRRLRYLLVIFYMVLKCRFVIDSKARMGSWSHEVAIAKYGSSLGCIVEDPYAESSYAEGRM